ncbi:MAG: hypothetical protein PHQ28_00940 [Mycobacterium sp.]|nr:hypothetical protein [Mycobacterium sp.]
MTTTGIPSGAVIVDEWQPEGYRVVWSARHGTDAEPEAVWASCRQFSDGSLGELLVHVHLRDDYGGITPAAARQLGVALINAADQADAWGLHQR